MFRVGDDVNCKEFGDGYIVNTLTVNGRERLDVSFSQHEYYYYSENGEFVSDEGNENKKIYLTSLADRPVTLTRHKVENILNCKEVSISKSDIDLLLTKLGF